MRALRSALITSLAAMLLGAFAGGAKSRAASAGGRFALAGQPAAGGGASSGGPFALTGAVAIPAAGSSSGGGFVLMAPAPLLDAVRIEVGEVALEITLNLAGQVQIMWPADAAGFELEFATALGPGAVWERASPAPAGNNFTAPASGDARFFRLIRR